MEANAPAPTAVPIVIGTPPSAAAGLTLPEFLGLLLRLRDLGAWLEEERTRLIWFLFSLIVWLELFLAEPFLPWLIAFSIDELRLTRVPPAATEPSFFPLLLLPPVETVAMLPLKIEDRPLEIWRTA